MIVNPTACHRIVEHRCFSIFASQLGCANRDKRISCTLSAARRHPLIELIIVRHTAIHTYLYL